MFNPSDTRSKKVQEPGGGLPDFLPVLELLFQALGRTGSEHRQHVTGTLASRWNGKREI